MEAYGDHDDHGDGDAGGDFDDHGDVGGDYDDENNVDCETHLTLTAPLFCVGLLVKLLGFV